ncbi:beta-ketoacyl synthase N-terminal-like domain-containing protein [Xenophilus arseniciresistens]|uniref:Beta-ketoacyl synthase N-terminal-like domain-containing protein n=1 Tax=Xenophilus arseniciresistens TaxID=1283306 RepID=A0AAE3N863_9BURK|nr:beta-ketoacyl synthase N-terminal-like domain-containing protein [Xenophilus arseniciresistens]MDA7416353.1 beta-ketoacyl synthase N-terminal-like domain-containing protein [Xenophilus arseniciresistens]
MSEQSAQRLPVHVAGRGLVSSLGWGWAAARAALQRPPADAGCVEVAPGHRWPLHRLPPLPGPWQARLAQAVRAVVAQTGLQPQPGMALFIGSSSLDMGYEEEQAGLRAPAFAGDLHSFADAVARALDWPGPVFCFSSACTSSAQALMAARDWLQAGEGSDALVLGVEMDNLFTPAGFGGLQLLSPLRARPFGAQRDGLVLGQAVAALHLCTAPTRWRLAGAAHAVDGSQPTGAAPQAIEAAARAALAQAGCTPAQLGLVKPQAAGSPGNDAAEAQALHALFGAQGVPPLIGFKPWIGHCMGASAAVELALLLGCLEERLWPAALAPDAQPDPALNLRWLALHEAPASLARVLFHTIGFGGGHNAWVLEAQPS